MRACERSNCNFIHLCNNVAFRILRNSNLVKIFTLTQKRFLVILWNAEWKLLHLSKMDLSKFGQNMAGVLGLI